MDVPLDEVHAALEAVVKVALPATTGEDLGLDDYLVRACS